MERPNFINFVPGEWTNALAPPLDVPLNIFDSPTDVANSGFFDDGMPCSGSWPNIPTEDLDSLGISHGIKCEPSEELTTKNNTTDQRSPFVNADSTQSSSIPSKKNWPGKYHFDISFAQQAVHKLAKSASWTYSEEQDKLYVSMEVNCVINFRMDTASVPNGCIIRAMPVFENDDNINEMVRRCPVHCRADHHSNQGHSAPDHFVRCSNALAEYVCSDNSHRFSVIVPLETPEAGTNICQYAYQFMCLNSCPGGINRRPLMLLFTLEKNGEVLGRRALQVRVCACPGRDRKMDEKDRTRTGRSSASTASAHGQHSSVNVVSMADVESIASLYNSRQNREEDERVVLVPVRAKHLDSILRLKYALEVPPLVIREHFEQDPHIRGVESNGEDQGSIESPPSTSTSTGKKSMVKRGAKTKKRKLAK